jgi:hypothetical protein
MSRLISLRHPLVAEYFDDLVSARHLHAQKTVVRHRVEGIQQPPYEDGVVLVCGIDDIEEDISVWA